MLILSLSLYIYIYIERERVIERENDRACLKIDATHEYDNDLLLRQETQIKIACPGSWFNNN